MEITGCRATVSNTIFQDSTFSGISAFFGVLISLGSSSAISNTIAGFIITYMRPYKKGDWIKVNNEIGKVIQKSALVTRIRTITNEDITIPNSMILTNMTRNYSFTSENGLIIPIPVYVNYFVDFETVNRLLIEAALEVKDIERQPAPFVFKNKVEETGHLISAQCVHPQSGPYVLHYLRPERKYSPKICRERHQPDVPQILPQTEGIK